MTLANYITIFRIFLIPVFAILAWAYGQSVLADAPIEFYRYTALIVFAVAAASDALDGYVARKYDQSTRLGSYLDPIADKFLLFSAIIILSWVPWGGNDWQIPVWFAWMVIIRDLSIGTAVAMIYLLNHHVIMRVNISSKLNTIANFITIGWVMLKNLSPFLLSTPPWSVLSLFCFQATNTPWKPSANYARKSPKQARGLNDETFHRGRC